ncbi:MAG: hypothetical protein D6820_14355, partial [Lentisphaerae bacterium]
GQGRGAFALEEETELVFWYMRLREPDDIEPNDGLRRTLARWGDSIERWTGWLGAYYLRHEMPLWQERR